MTPNQIESWALGDDMICDRPVEDLRVEVKSRWPTGFNPPIMISTVLIMLPLIIQTAPVFSLGHEKPSEPVNRSEAGLTGPVHFVEEQSKRGRAVTEYDPKGMLVREYNERTDSNGIVKSREEIIFEYDPYGKRIRKTTSCMGRPWPERLMPMIARVD